jgi:WD40 repeat protein
MMYRLTWLLVRFEGARLQPRRNGLLLLSSRGDLSRRGTANRQLATIASLLLTCALSAVAASKPIAKMQLPCPADFQTLSPDGTQLVVSCHDSSLVVLSVPEGKALRTIPADQKPNASAYSHDGKQLAIGYWDGTVEITSTHGNAPARRWKAGSRRIDQLLFLTDGKTLVVGPADEPARVWSLAEPPQLLASLPFQFGGMSAGAVTPDGKLLIVAGGDTTVRFYDTSTWQKTNESSQFLLETFALEFTPDGKQVLVGGADSRITVLDAATAKQLRQLPTDAGSYIVGLAMMGDHHRAATVYLDDAGKKPPHAVIWDLANAKSEPLGNGMVPTCGEKVAGKLWMCSTDGNTLAVSEWD